jgi:hypothetical protein
MLYLIAVVFKYATKYIFKNVGAEIANVCKVVDCGAAGVKTHGLAIWTKWAKGSELSRECIVELYHGCIVAQRKNRLKQAVILVERAGVVFAVSAVP